MLAVAINTAPTALVATPNASGVSLLLTSALRRLLGSPMPYGVDGVPYTIVLTLVGLLCVEFTLMQSPTGCWRTLAVTPSLPESVFARFAGASITVTEYFRRAWRRFGFVYTAMI
ncbi:sodium/proton antiporter [Klebsiella pneumoniae]|uniref:Sodium/proton antiporter n=1 Tax=Klebsiella pneumoniae TaxID=573 RepID=A0A2X3HA38_KLEPN|nr:sodium/proton antiporter [Klebsiella pneumoniae]